MDNDGHTQASLDVQEFRKLLGFRHYNFMRGDLEQVLYATVGEGVPIRFGTNIHRLYTQPNGLTIELSDGTTQNCNLLIGADGSYSNVRQLVWGEEAQFEHFLGYYVACSIIDDFVGTGETFYSHLEPGTQAIVYSIRGDRMATLFAFKSPGLDVHDGKRRFDALSSVFGNQGWIILQLLEATKQSPTVHFDAVSQIELDTWHRGRVALIGDACQCLTLLAGQGASMAMIGAYILADELQKAESDDEVAFRGYQSRLKPEIDRRQLEARKLAGTFVPDSHLSIWLMHLYLKLAFLPGFRSLFLRRIGARNIIE